MKKNKIQQAFFELVRAGLWEKDARLSQFNDIDVLDFSAIMELAEEQSVVGLLTAGMEHVIDVKIPKDILLQFVGSTLLIEQQGKAMNEFVASIIERMRKADIYTLLVKGQGVAQCYLKPLWRSSGDIDLFLSDDNYSKAKSLLLPQASSADEEDTYREHLGMTFGSWVVELHGNMYCGVSRRADKGIEDVKRSLFYLGEVRSWMCGNTQVFLPSANNDAIILFTHILQHFFYGGIGLRQVCDWCRLLWTYRESLNLRLLESRISKMGLMTEWKTFAALAVDTLGMPVEAMPLYSSSKKWSHKAEKVMALILETGNFGHNRDNNYYQNHSFWVYKAISLWRITRDSFKHMMIFPMDAIRVWFHRLGDGIKVVLKGK